MTSIFERSIDELTDNEFPFISGGIRLDSCAAEHKNVRCV